MLFKLETDDLTWSFNGQADLIKEEDMQRPDGLAKILRIEVSSSLASRLKSQIYVPQVFTVSSVLIKQPNLVAGLSIEGQVYKHMTLVTKSFHSHLDKPDNLELLFRRLP